MRKLLILPLLALSACVPTPADNPGTVDGASDPAEALGALRAHVEELSARAEHDEQQIEVQHILISFGSKVPGATRTQDAAEQLAADLYARIQGGADFDALVREHTDDSHPGIYGMHLAGSQPSLGGSIQRSGMVAAFGNVGWRLAAVGEVGVAAFHQSKSPYGWHIVKRTR